MNQFLSDHFAVVALVVLIAGIALAVLSAALLARRSERRQARALNRLRHDAEQQAEATLRLGESLNAALRQNEAMSGSLAGSKRPSSKTACSFSTKFRLPPMSAASPSMSCGT